MIAAKSLQRYYVPTPAKAGVWHLPPEAGYNNRILAASDIEINKCGFAAGQTPAFAGVGEDGR